MEEIYFVLVNWGDGRPKPLKDFSGFHDPQFCSMCVDCPGCWRPIEWASLTPIIAYAPKVLGPQLYRIEVWNKRTSQRVDSRTCRRRTLREMYNEFVRDREETRTVEIVPKGVELILP